MKQQKLAELGAVIAVSIAVLGGCASNEVVAPTVSVSVGQQLIDLKNARNSGALTEREYTEQKARLIHAVK